MAGTGNKDKRQITDPIELDEPIVRGDQTIDKIQLRRPKGGELRGLSMHDIMKVDVDTMRQLLPRITMPTITVEEVDNLDPADLGALAVEAAGFFLTREMRGSLPK